MPRPVHVVKGKAGVSLVPHHDRDQPPHVGLGSAAMAAIVVAALLAGGAGGVVLSPDEPTPSPDWHGIVDDIVVERLADHLEFDHIPDTTEEASPSTPPSTSPDLSPSPSPTRPTSPTASPRPRLATPKPTARPTPMPTVTSAPTASPLPSPTCFRPGKPHSSPDPCAWPPDG